MSTHKFARINTDGVYQSGFDAGVESVSGPTTQATTSSAPVDSVACGEDMMYNPENEVCCEFDSNYYLVQAESACLHDIFTTTVSSTTTASTTTTTTTPTTTTTTTTPTTTTTTTPTTT